MANPKQPSPLSGFPPPGDANPRFDPRNPAGADPKGRPNRKLLAAALAAFLVLLFAVPLGLALEAEIRRVELESEKLDVGGRMNAVRATLEGTLSQALSISLGPAAQFALAGELDTVTFQALAERLLVETPEVHRISLSRGTTVVAAEPRFGNTEMIGLDYQMSPEHWPQVARAIDQRSSVLAGPIDTEHFGSALIHRRPVFAQSDNRFLGVISTIVSVDDLLFDVSDIIGELQFAMRGQDGQGAEGRVFYGGEEVFGPGAEAVQRIVSLPGGIWLIAALPKNGWAAASVDHLAAIRLLWIGLAFAAATGTALLTAYIVDRRDAIQRLRFQEARFRSLIEDAPDAMIFVNANGMIMRVNRQAESLFGYSAAELQNMSVDDLVPPASRTEHPSLREQFYLEQDSRPLAEGRQLGALHRSGRIVPVEISLGFSGEGSNRLVTATVRDVSRRISAEKARKHAEDILREALESISEGFVIFDEDDRLILCNDAYRNLYKASSAAIRIGAKFEDILRFGVRQGQFAELGPTDSPEQFIQNRLRQHQNPVGSIVHKTNDGRWIQISERRTSSGRYVGIRADITELKEAETALSRSAERSRTLLATSPIGVALVTPGERVLYANSRVHAMLGIESGQIISDDHTAFVDPDLRQTIMEELSAGSGFVEREAQLYNADGKPFWALVAVANAEFEGRGTVVLWIFDIDARKEAERALEESRTLLEQRAEELQKASELSAMEHKRAESAIRARGDFLANVSHEIRTPMTAVLGMADLLCSGQLPSQERKYADTLRRSAQALLVLINDILDFSKIESGQFSLESFAFNPRNVLSDVVTMLEVTAQSKNLSLRLDYVPGATDQLPDMVMGDPFRLRQILINLVGNGLKFTDSGHVILRLADCDMAADGRHTVTLEVEDTGIGIDATAGTQLFDPFVQGSSGPTRKFSGTGLGLAICRHLTEAMGGMLSHAPNPDGGTIFRLVLPFAKATEPRSDMTRTEGQADTAPGMPSQPLELLTDTPQDLGIPRPMAEYSSGRRILIAEDTEPVRFLLETMLHRFGHGVDSAEDGAKAVAMALKTSYDLILLDMHMPHLDGLDCARRIRNTEGPNQSTPIMTLSADPRAATLSASDGLDIQDHLLKPVNWTVLQSVLERYFSDGHTAGQSAPGATSMEAYSPADPPSRDSTQPTLYGTQDTHADADLAVPDPTTGSSDQTDGTQETAAFYFDQEIVKGYQARLGVDRAESLINAAIASLDPTIAKITSALEARDTHAARDAAHGLKGMAAQFGLSAIAHQAELLQDHLDTHHQALASGTATPPLPPNESTTGLVNSLQETVEHSIVAVENLLRTS